MKLVAALSHRVIGVSPVALLLTASLLGGCGSPPLLYGDSVPVTGSGTGDTPDMAKAPEYPPGPYGNQEGETLTQLKMSGYRLSPTATDPDKLGWDETIDMNDYHANPACKCLLITMGATWCGACQQEQPYLVREVNADPGFCVVNILQEGIDTNKDATREDVDDWVDTFKQNFYVTQGTAATKRLWSGYGSTISLPFNLIVKPETMAVLGAVPGFDPQIHEKAMELCGAQ